MNGKLTLYLHSIQIIIWCNKVAMELLFGNHNLVDELKLKCSLTWFPYEEF